MNPAIDIRGVGKRYRKMDEQAMLLRSLIPFGGAKRSDFWALRDITFQVEPGETVGVIGRNGAGKTTLLRLLAGVSQPTEGRVRVEGPIAPLISVGVGFHREMSGRENVFVNGMLLGLTQAQIEERFAAIVAFAELEDFIDTPVKFYSSGMFMRLGFSVAVHVDPRVLLVDEVLAVGDATFQAKCFERMRTIKEAGTTIVLVSHSMHAIRSMCPRTLLILDGRLEFDGETSQTIAHYHETLSQAAADRPPMDHEQVVVGGATILSWDLQGTNGAGHYSDPDTPLALTLCVRFDREVESPTYAISVRGEDGSVVYARVTRVPFSYRRYRAGEIAEVAVRLEPRLGGGTYQFLATVATDDGRGLLVADDPGPYFYVRPRPSAWGSTDLAARITADGIDLTADERQEVDDRPDA